MPRRTCHHLLPTAALCVLAAAHPRAQQPASPTWTINDATANAFGYPSPLLTASERRGFAVGNSFFRANWVAAPASAQGLDGLGPLFNARSCSSCHLRDGRSRPPEAGEPAGPGLLLRIGLRAAAGPDAPHPLYGTQIQDAAISGVAAEARIEVTWRTTKGTFGDGEPFELVAPAYELRDLAFGPLGEGTVTSGRVAPHLVGLGLLEAIPEADLIARADPDDRDGDGISGRVHRASDGVIGRFGWKATQPTVRLQVATALAHDMGITSTVHRTEPLMSAQRESITFASGGDPEIDDHKLGRLAFYSRTLAVPAPRDAGAAAVTAGRAHFVALGCVKCHVETWRTGALEELPAFAGLAITPYTDLLLHDLGPGLADGKHDGDALPAEWRTPPLWGIGLFAAVSGHERYLHDGRARGLAEAVLWHGGEAEAAREAFRRAPRAQRDELLAFLRSL